MDTNCNSNPPGSRDIYYKYNIGFSIGENRAQKTNITEQSVKETPSKLVDFIVNTHHSYLNEELPILSDYSNKIMKLHGKNHSELFQVHRLFNHLRTELEEHIVKEEEFLFPLIKKYEEEKSQDNKKRIKKLINELEQENTDAEKILNEIRELTHDYLLPEDSCKTFASTYRNLQMLEGDLFQHIHLENNILFKNF